MTRDISTSGIFFETETAYSVGDTIGLSVEFPDSTVQCKGQVIRVEKIGGSFGIAVELGSYWFH